jgi:hypothetical protein
MMKVFALFLAALIVAGVLVSHIDVTVTAGPSKKPQPRCYDDEAVEKGDFVVMTFDAYIDDSSETGPIGRHILSSLEHSEKGERPIVT